MLVRAKTRCEGFFVKKGIWLKLLNSEPGIKAQLSIGALNFYERIWKYVSTAKQKMKKKMLRRRDYQHVITLEDTELAHKMNMWRMKEKLLMSVSKSERRQITLQLADEKKYAKETSEDAKKKLGAAEEQVYNFCHEWRKFDEANEIILEENKALMRENDLLRTLMGEEPQHAEPYKGRKSELSLDLSGSRDLHAYREPQNSPSKTIVSSEE